MPNTSPLAEGMLDGLFFGDKTMTDSGERRIEKRLRYNWPVWFAENFNDILTQGQMIDVSSRGAAFSCYADKCPWQGQHITARFSVPHYESGESFDLENFVRDGYICRIDEISPYVRRVAIQFAEPLPFKPGEDIADADACDETLGMDVALEQTSDEKEIAEEPVTSGL